MVEVKEKVAHQEKVPGVNLEEKKAAADLIKKALCARQ